MVTLDLNIELKEVVKENIEDGKDFKGAMKFKVVEVSPPTVALRWIGIMMENAINKPKLDPRSNRMVPTVRVKLEVHRAYSNVMNALEKNSAGIAELEPEQFEFLNRKYHQAELSVQAEISSILVLIDDKINKAAAQLQAEKGGE